MPTTVVVVGAGIAGLLAARALAEAGHHVVVLDKGSVVGGRLATRRLSAGPHGDALVDSGAQFFTARSGELAPLVTSWLERGVARPWFAGKSTSDDDLHYCATGGMAALAAELARGLDVRCGHVVTAITPHARAGAAHLGGSLGHLVGSQHRHWRIRARAHGVDTVLDAAAVVVTAPVPQARALLLAGGTPLTAADDEQLRVVTYTSCLAVLAVLDGPSGIEAPGARRVGGPVVDWVADNAAKGISPWPAVTIHASASFSAEHGTGPRRSRARSGSERTDDRPDDRRDDTVAQLLLDEVGLAGRLLGAPSRHGNDSRRLAPIVVERWRYAKPVDTAPGDVLVLDGVPPAVLAGDGFGGPRVESAALSGLTAGRTMVELLA